MCSKAVLNTSVYLDKSEKENASSVIFADSIQLRVLKLVAVGENLPEGLKVNNES